MFRPNEKDLPYENLVKVISESLESNIVPQASKVLFHTDVDTKALWNIYLDQFLIGHRHQYNCSACEYFFHKAAGLVYIDPVTFKTKTAIWHSLPDGFKGLGKSLTTLVESANITKPFALTKFDRTIIGTAEAGGVQHLHASLPNTLLIKADSTKELTALIRSYKALTQQIKKESLTNLGSMINDINSKHYNEHVIALVSGLRAYSSLIESLTEDTVLNDNKCWNFVVRYQQIPSIVIRMLAMYNRALLSGVNISSVDIWENSLSPRPEASMAVKFGPKQLFVSFIIKRG